VAKKSSRRRRRGGSPSRPDLKDPLLFIDTNILLDFYRARNEQNLTLLDRIDAVQDRVITTYQVEMEFKKNRQKAIIESSNALKISDQVSTPAYLTNHKSLKAARKRLKDTQEMIDRVRQSLHLALFQPTSHDPVYKVVQRLFSCRSPFNLTRDNEMRYSLRRLAFKRFILGYPPRKSNDTSIGDAINWEWIVTCATPAKRDVVIVSRDSDYGVAFGNEAYVNDWLLREFKQRVSKQGLVVLTPKLSEALKYLAQPVTAQEVAGESELIANATQARVISRDALSAFLEALAEKRTVSPGDAWPEVVEAVRTAWKPVLKDPLPNPTPPPPSLTRPTDPTPATPPPPPAPPPQA
jgi:predicted nucleic acid-binding protein